MDRFEKDFVYFRTKCENLTNLVATFRTLYESGDETRRILKNTAREFFVDLNGWLNEVFHLHVGRLTDPASMNGRSNLSVSYVLDQLSRHNLSSDLARSLGEEINCFGRVIKPGRHKRIAHTDLEATRDPNSLGKMTKEQLNNFIANVNGFTDEVGTLIGIGPLDYGSSSWPGDATDLLSTLVREGRLK